MDPGAATRVARPTVGGVVGHVVQPAVVVVGVLAVSGGLGAAPAHGHVSRLEPPVTTYSPRLFAFSTDRCKFIVLSKNSRKR